MKNHVVVFSLLLSLLFARSFAAEQDSSAKSLAVKDNNEVARLYAEDQSDRQPKDDRTEIDWKIVGPRDEVRQTRIMELYAADELKTGRDFYHAGMILQHGELPEGYLLGKNERHANALHI